MDEGVANEGSSRFITLSDLFNWPSKDPIGLYPFEVKCLVVDWNPMDYPELVELGKPVLDFIFGRSDYVPRQVRGGMVCIYMPERWLNIHEKVRLMQSLYDFHKTHPLKYVHIITQEPIIISDFTADMVRVSRIHKDSARKEVSDDDDQARTLSALRGRKFGI